MVWNMTTEAVSFKRKGPKIILTDKDGKIFFLNYAENGYAE